jgi:hypothetical protein
MPGSECDLRVNDCDKCELCRIQLKIILLESAAAIKKTKASFRCKELMEVRRKLEKVAQKIPVPPGGSLTILIEIAIVKYILISLLKIRSLRALRFAAQVARPSDVHEQETSRQDFRIERA